MLRAAIVAAAAFVPMLLEARRSRRNDAILRARGAVEPPGDVYAWMQIAYPGCFVAIVAEAALRQQPAGVAAAAGAVIFVLAKALKYSAIAALGDRWTFRVLVLPGAAARHVWSLPMVAPPQLRRRRRRADRCGAHGRQPSQGNMRLRVSGVSAESPMTHEFLHDAEGVPLSVRPMRKGFARSGLITLPMHF